MGALPNLSSLKERLVYNPYTGLFLKDGTKWVGKKFHPRDNLYLTIYFKGGKYSAHRLAWYLAYGKPPREGYVIDHINGDRGDNRIINLRELTIKQNCKSHILKEVTMATNGGSPKYDQITIQGQTFRVPIRYEAGHTLNDGEAGALNQTFHENLRNNFAKKVAEGVEAGVGLDVLQQQLDDYAQEYQFGVRTGGGGYRGDPVMTLALNIAREMVRQAVKAKGLDADDWPPSRISQAAKALLESQGDDGKILQTARKQVDAEKEAAKEAMASVSEILDSSQAAAAQ